MYLRQKHKRSSALLSHTRIKCDSLCAVDSGLKSSSSSSCFSFLLLTPQSFASDSWGVGSGPAAAEAVSSGPAQQVAADPAVLRLAARPGWRPASVCVDGWLQLTDYNPACASLCLQMKQSLEKLHQGIVVPEVKQDPPADAESLTEA